MVIQDPLHRLNQLRNIYWFYDVIFTWILANHSHFSSISIENIDSRCCPHQGHTTEWIWNIINSFYNNNDRWVIGSDKFIFTYSPSTQCKTIKSENWSSSSCSTREISLLDSLTNCNITIWIRVSRINTSMATLIASKFQLRNNFEPWRNESVNIVPWQAPFYQ